MPDINLFPHIDTLSDDLCLLALKPDTGLTGHFTVGELKTYYGATGGGGEPTSYEATFEGFEDNKDILYYLGSDGGESIWQNPHTTGKVIVSASSVLGGQSPISTVVGRTAEFFHTESTANPWVQISLQGTQTFKLKRWVYQARGNDTQFIPNRLLVSLSTNGTDFTQVQDHSFTIARSEHTLSPELANMPNAKVIRWTLPASSYLTVGRFAIYGTLNL